MLTSMRSFLVLISGVAGSGKSMLAKRLAPALDLPLTSKGHDQGSAGGQPRAWGRRLVPAARRSFEVLWALLRDVPQTVLETSWHPDRARVRLKALRRPVFEIHCTCPDDVLSDRIRGRLQRDRHPIHREAINPAMIDSFAATNGDGVVGVGPVLQVDTTVSPDLDLITSWIDHHRLAIP